jgi:hypothetical protein
VNPEPIKPCLANDGCTPQPVRRAWHNHLPDWIRSAAEFRRLSVGVRHTLQAIADQCDAPDSSGNLLKCWGGKCLRELALVCPATFWRHIKKLMDVGFVVQIERGGGKANAYAIPGQPGNLDHVNVRRGRQMPLWSEPDSGSRTLKLVPPACQGNAPGTSDNSSPVMTHRLRMRQGVSHCETGDPSQSETQPSWLPSPFHQDHDHGAVEQRGTDMVLTRKAGRKSGPRLRHVEPGALRSLLQLAKLYRDAGAKGLLSGGKCEYTWLQFVAAAMHAGRVGQQPERLFAAIVNRGQWLYLSNGDEDRAQRWIRKCAAYDPDEIVDSGGVACQEDDQSRREDGTTYRAGLAAQTPESTTC